MNPQIHTTKTRVNDYPFYSKPVKLYPMDDGNYYACFSPWEIGLGADWPIMDRPDHRGGFYRAAVFTPKQAQELKA